MCTRYTFSHTVYTWPHPVKPSSLSTPNPQSIPHANMHVRCKPHTSLTIHLWISTHSAYANGDE